MARESSTLEELRKSAVKQEFTHDQVIQFAAMTAFQRLDKHLVAFGDKLTDLTLDNATEEIIRLKNSKIAQAQGGTSNAPSVSQYRDQVEKAKREIASQKKEIEHLKTDLIRARSFRYLIRTFAERVLEKLGLRKAQHLP